MITYIHIKAVQYTLSTCRNATCAQELSYM